MNSGMYKCSLFRKISSVFPQVDWVVYDRPFSKRILVFSVFLQTHLPKNKAGLGVWHTDGQTAELDE
jgi:hypothetical protein